MYKLKRVFKKNKIKDRNKDLAPDEIFIDSENLPDFDEDQFEGRIEKSISSKTFFFFGSACFLVLAIFFGRAYFLQSIQGETYVKRSEQNYLRNTLLFTKRGIIFDRNDSKIAWNVASDTVPEFNLRKYTDLAGLSTVLGYVKYPSKDKYGFYYSTDYDGKDGVEQFFNDKLTGVNGEKIVEVDAAGKVQTENVVRPPIDGENIKLSIDSGLQNKVFSTIEDLAQKAGFSGGAGVIVDVNTGEIISMASYPEYDSQILTDGSDSKKINFYLNDKNKPFLDRAIDGLYTPGSIVKPYMAVAALSENVIDQFASIFSSGSISIPNPYDSEHPTIFNDWKAHGYTDMRKALAVSSDVYFYEIGGGFQGQKGLGIGNIDKYMKMFGFGSQINSPFFKGSAGTVPTPEWKKINFNNDDWRIGDTYHTSIGQYGFQVSPIQAARAMASIANGGKLLEPTILFGDKLGETDLNINPDYLKVIREGMHDAVTKDYGLGKGLYSNDYSIAIKTGTAELGNKKQFVNSWITGFFPYDNPKYAFAVIMERGPSTNSMGGVYIMRQVMDWIALYRSQYVK